MTTDGVHDQTQPGHARCRRTPLLRVQQVQLVREGSTPFVLKQITSSTDAYVAFRVLCESADREFAWTVLLNNKNRVIGIEEVSRGCLTSALLHPRLCAGAHKRGYVAGRIMCCEA